MSKIHVTPLVEGFPVKDAEGNLIPAKGCKVEDSAVVRRRVKEGLLEVRGESTKSAATGSTDDEPDEGDEFDLGSLTVAELKKGLEHHGVAIPDGAKKAALVELLADALEAAAK